MQEKAALLSPACVLACLFVEHVSEAVSLWLINWQLGSVFV
jgi:hypothetical protein